MRAGPLTAPKRCCTGFTLVEALVTVAILVIIASIAVPSFRSVTDTAQTQQVAKQLMSDMLLARKFAQDLNTLVKICRMPSRTSYSCAATGEDLSSGWVVFRDPGNSNTVTASNLLLARPAASNITVTANWNATSQFYFTSSGTAMTSGGQLANGSFTIGVTDPAARRSVFSYVILEANRGPRWLTDAQCLEDPICR